jgi:hypothetical protein
MMEKQINLAKLGRELIKSQPAKPLGSAKGGNRILCVHPISECDPKQRETLEEPGLFEIGDNPSLSANQSRLMFGFPGV